LKDQPVRPAIRETRIAEDMEVVEMVVVEEVEVVSD